ncbi:carboxypeptidase-like regulatory domain-containing protein [Gemmatimonas sp.]|uniref:carboxypeptidase-like regulatory domain-containing protein n=1 Tax=Gemmatimonas sp. TaxID=1962908 RepID=UPI003983BBAF
MTSPSQLTAQGSGDGTLAVTVSARQTGVSLSYAVVALPDRRIERFTDASGRASIVALPAGTYDITVRRIGFAPYRGRVVIEASRVTSAPITLAQIPVQLTGMLVRPREACTKPGMPDRMRDPAVYDVVELLRENADQFRLLTLQYPFRYATQRVLAALADSAVFVQTVDTLVAESRALGGYRPGGVVREQRAPGGGTETTMVIPVLSDIAAPSFIANHCFHFGGVVTEGGETWVRLEVRAADKLRTPDVHGTFFLDSATAQLRRMELEMSRPDRLPRRLQGIRTVAVATTFRDITPGLSLIDRVCAINWQKRIQGRGPSHPVELQQLTAYRFDSAPPDAPLASAYNSPVWRPRTQLSRDVLWCTEHSPSSG